jgi:hypothetical protein
MLYTKTIIPLFSHEASNSRLNYYKKQVQENKEQDSLTRD